MSLCCRNGNLGFSLSEYCMPFVKIGGFFVPYKSGEIEDELKSAGRRADLEYWEEN